MSPTELAGGLTILASVALFARVSASRSKAKRAKQRALRLNPPFPANLTKTGEFIYIVTEGKARDAHQMETQNMMRCGLFSNGP